MDPVKNILNPDVTCWYWFHGDQDDLICPKCAKKLKHTDTWYVGMPVSRYT